MRLDLSYVEVRAFGRMSARPMPNGGSDVIVLFAGDKPLVMNYHAVWALAPCCTNFTPADSDQRLYCGSCESRLSLGAIIARIGDSRSVDWLTSWMQWAKDLNVLEASLNAIEIWSDLNKVWLCTLEDLEKISEDLRAVSA